MGDPSQIAARLTAEAAAGRANELFGSNENLLPSGEGTANGTYIVADGQPGLIENAGANLYRAAMTAKTDLEATGATVGYYGTITGIAGFQNLLDTAAKVGATSIFLFTHGDPNRILLGDGAPNDQNSITMTNVGKLVNRASSLVALHIYGCNAGFKDNGIAAALAKQLNVWVHASTTGMSFSNNPARLTGGKVHPDTGPTYMVPEGRGRIRPFPPPRWP